MSCCEENWVKRGVTDGECKEISEDITSELRKRKTTMQFGGYIFPGRGNTNAKV